jgi:tetratricopeptide (TPR) repeat protein
MSGPLKEKIGIFMKKNNIKYSIVILSSLIVLALPAYASNLQDGINLFNSQQYDQAIQLLNKISETEPKNPEPHLWLYKCYEATFDLESYLKEKKIYEYLKGEYDKEQEKLKQNAVKKPPAENEQKPPDLNKETPTAAITIDNEKIKEFQKSLNKTPAPGENTPAQKENSPEKSTSLPSGTATVNAKDKNLLEILSTGPDDHDFVYFNCIAFSPDGKYIAAGQGYNGDVTIRDLAGKVVKALKPHEKEVLQLAYSPKGDYLITGGFDQKVKVIEPDTGKVIKTIDTGKKIDTLAISPDGNYAATDGFSKILLWNLKTGKNVSPVKETVPVKFMRFNPKYSYLASANEFGFGPQSTEVSIWDVTTGKRVNLLKNPDSTGIFAFTPDGKFLASGSGQNIVVWNSTGVLVKTIQNKGQDPVTALSYSPDGKYLASGIQNGTRQAEITLWDSKTYKEVKKFSIDRYGVVTIIFSPNSKYLAARGFGGNVIWLWKL